MDLLLAFGGALVGSIPLLAVTITGIAVAILRRGKHLRVSVLAVLGLSALTLSFLGTAAVSVYDLEVGRRTGQHLEAFFLYRIVILNAVLYILNVSGVALVTWAIFARRGPLPSTSTAS